jgi:phosphatidylglycerol lysyltransferase
MATSPMWLIRRTAAPAISLLLFVVALTVLHRIVGDVTLADVYDEFASLSGGSILGAIGATALSYAVLTGYDLIAVRYLGRNLPYRHVALISFNAFAIGHTVRLAVLSAGSVRYRLYTAAGFSAVEIGTIIDLCTFTFGLGTLFLVGLVFMIEPRMAADVLHLPTGIVIGLGAAFLAAIAAYGMADAAGAADRLFLRGGYPALRL